ncbi:MAG: hypothetical protein R2688_00025 [Fimbriimonadaceae bacterium]
MSKLWLLATLLVVGSLGIIAGCSEKDAGEEQVTPDASEYQKSEDAPSNGRSRGGSDLEGGPKGG